MFSTFDLSIYMVKLGMPLNWDDENNFRKMLSENGMENKRRFS